MRESGRPLTGSVSGARGMVDLMGQASVAGPRYAYVHCPRCRLRTYVGRGYAIPLNVRPAGAALYGRYPQSRSVMMLLPVTSSARRRALAEDPTGPASRANWRATQRSRRRPSAGCRCDRLLIAVDILASAARWPPWLGRLASGVLLAARAAGLSRSAANVRGRSRATMSAFLERPV
jgi:hypothetical protein